jgi:hypothetical protein
MALFHRSSRLPVNKTYSMNFKPLLFVILLGFSVSIMNAQDKPAVPTLTGTGEFKGETPPLRDIPAMSAAEYQLMKLQADKKLLNKKLRKRFYPFKATALPKGSDAVWQKTMGDAAVSNAPILNFDGQTSPYYPPDCNGAAGPNHYMQTINSTYAIYNKSGTLMAGPTNMNLLFGTVTGSGCNDGDPLILYDEQASRWLAVEFSICGANDYMLIAVSTTSDPTGTWYKYSFDVADMPDYEKFGIWQDGYYMADNNASSNDIYVFQRSVMLTGGTSPGMVAFDNPNRPSSIDGFMCIPPVDNDGAFAPAGAPGIFIAFNDDAIAGGSDQLWIYELAVNWTTPSSSTFGRVQQLAVSPFDSDFGNDWTNIAQPGTTQQLDAIPQVIMNVPQYRNFGTYQTIVCCHTVDVDATDHAGVRWYELRRGTQTSGNWTVRQQGTYSPDIHSRWMGSISLNGSGKIGLGYSVSSSTVYPGIRYTGQSSSAYNAASGIMDIPEEVIHTGSYAQTGYERWGDYSAMSVDPTDDQTFWFTTQYIGTGGARKTKIASFKFGNTPTVTTTAASAIAGTTATLNGMVNPNGLATTYYFQYGLTTSYGSQTTTTSAGSGTTAISVSANITGLVVATTYHYRLVGVNSDGTTNGSDLTFLTLGAAEVTTTAASAITQTTATSGGNVTSDGGSPVTARGVCWATTANPVASGNHTTNGTGTGVFTSSITGLSASALYHVRAYATNANGTYYGTDLTFTTTCGLVSSFPWNEGFENGGTIPACWTQEQVNSSGIYYTFITGSGNNNPVSAHGGTLNACLKDVTATDNKTRLISPQINLSGITGATLTFWHTQAVWTPDQDQLIVYYRTSTTGTWTALATYTASITSWTMETITLPGGTNDYYIAFEGNAKYGYGVCIDDVSITGNAPAQPIVTTTAVTSISPTTAISGGNVTSPGSSSVTARGVCWGTSANPAITGNHTTDGTGAGIFTSSLTGLSPSTTYHIRAYATNASGTSYGIDLTFITACGPVSSFPWNEGFENGGSIPACWIQEQVNSSGINWTFISGNGTINPVSAHGGNLNACLKDVTSQSNKTRLITPPFNLTSLISPQLKFWHVQSLYSPDQDTLIVFYKTSFAGTWIQLAKYSSNITTWTQETLNLPNTESTCYIAFEGNACWGYGVCVDDVSITGTAKILSVSPTNQNVTPPAGNTVFNVTSNTGWTASSNQPWCTVTNAGTGNGLITSVYLQNISTTPRVATLTVSVAGLTPVVTTVTQEGVVDKVLNLTLFLEGLFNGTTMNKAKNATGDQFAGTVADQITLELHHSASPYPIAGGPYTVNVNTDGTASVTVPASLGSSYYIVVKHRNSLETWNASPLSFSGASMSYNFTSAAGQAFGNNLKPVSGKFVIFAGDVNQDGIVDAGDLVSVDNGAANLISGYLASDVNGDGIVNLVDLELAGANATFFVAKLTP